MVQKRLRRAAHIAVMRLREAVAGAPDRLEVARARGIGLELAAQAAHQAVDRAVVDHAIAAPDLLHQRLAAEHAAGPRREEVEKIELERRERDRFSVALDDATAPDRCEDRRCSSTRSVSSAARAPQQRAHPRHQLGGAERLRDVVVGADLEPEQLVALAGPRRHHEDRDVAVAADAARHLEPVEPGQAEVEHDERRLQAREVGQRAIPVARLMALVARRLEILRDQVGDAGIVFDQQHSLAHRHSMKLPQPMRDGRTHSRRRRAGRPSRPGRPRSDSNVRARYGRDMARSCRYVARDADSFRWMQSRSMRHRELARPHEMPIRRHISATVEESIEHENRGDPPSVRDRRGGERGPGLCRDGGEIWLRAVCREVENFERT